MAIIPSLLVSAAVLQDGLVDNTIGEPLANGIVTLYKDNSRTTFKNWYQLTGSPGAYTFTLLPNPMTLSGVGTIQDNNGNDVIPFFYPFSEADNTTPEFYYITVTDANGKMQFTRQNFPFGAFEQFTPTIENGLILKNYITNNVFWRNVGSLNATTLSVNPVSGLLSATIAPSNHDGFSMPDWEIIKQANGASDTITFSPFGAGKFLNGFNVNPQNQDVTPEYFLNFACTGAGAETFKYIQVPISLHIKTLETAPAVLVLWYRLNSSGANGNKITLTIQQVAGTGATNPVNQPSNTITMSTSTNFTKSETPFQFPSATGVALGNGGDDGLYLQIGYPVGTTFNIDIAKPQLYIGNQIPSNDVDTYDQVDSIVLTPRTGDIRTSLNSFTPFGWAPMNDGIISNGAVLSTPAPTPPMGINVSRQNIDTWQLFNLIWSINSAFAPIYDNTGAGSSRGATAIADWSAGKQLQLTKALGRTFLGLPPAFNVTSYTPGSAPSWNPSVNGFFTLPSTALLYVGAPVILTGTSLNAAFTSGNLYYAIPAIDGSDTTKLQLATSYANAIAGTAIAASGGGTGSSIVMTISLGGTMGQTTHLQLQNEVGIHQHAAAASTAGQFVCTGTGSPNNYGAGGAGTSNPPLTGNNTNFGGMSLTASNPFNIIQPSTYMNIFIKL